MAIGRFGNLPVTNGLPRVPGLLGGISGMQQGIQPGQVQFQDGNQLPGLPGASGAPQLGGGLPPYQPGANDGFSNALPPFQGMPPQLAGGVPPSRGLEGQPAWGNDNPQVGGMPPGGPPMGMNPGINMGQVQFHPGQLQGQPGAYGQNPGRMPNQNPGALPGQRFGERPGAYGIGNRPNGGWGNMNPRVGGR